MNVRDMPGYVGPPPSGPKCDFCWVMEPSWFYAGPPFTMQVGAGPVVFNAEGGFVACETCATLADRGDAEALARVALASIGRMADVYPAAHVLIRRLHAGLLGHATGERRKYVPEARP